QARSLTYGPIAFHSPGVPAGASASRACSAERATPRRPLSAVGNGSEGIGRLNGFRSLQLRLGGGHDIVDRKSEVLLQGFQRRRSAEGAQADDTAGRAHIALPAEGRGLLDRDAGANLRRQDAVAVSLRLPLEDVPGGHRDDARADAVGDKLLMCIDGEADLAAA